MQQRWIACLPIFNELGLKAASLLKQKQLHDTNRAGAVLQNIVSDLAPESSNLLRIIKDSNNSELVELLLRSKSAAELKIRKSQLVSHSASIYSPEALACFDEFLDGFCEGFLSAETIASSTATSETVTSQFNRPQQLEINIATSSLSPESRDNQQVKTGQIIPRLFTRNRALALAGVATVALALAAVTSRPPESSTELPKESAVNNTTDSYTGALERGYIRLGAQAESPPLNYVEDGERKGLDYEILKLIAGQKEFGLTKAGSVSGDINTDEYSDIPLLLNKTDNRGSHTVDIVAGGLTFKDGDIDNVRFTIPYLEGFGYALLTPKNSTIRTLADLKEKRVGVIDGGPDVRAYASRTASKSTLVKLSDADETWITDAFDAGKVDAIIYDFPFASTETQGTSVNIAVANLPGSKIE